MRITSAYLYKIVLTCAELVHIIKIRIKSAYLKRKEKQNEDKRIENADFNGRKRFNN